MKRTVLIAALLVASQQLLLGAAVYAKWVIDCGGGACAGTVRANSPFGPPRDALLTALAIAAPYLLIVLVAAVTWLLTSRTASQPAAESFSASSARQAGVGLNGNSSRIAAFRAEGAKT
jgi:hypothetical protein